MLKYFLIVLVLGSLSSELIQATGRVCLTRATCSALNATCKCYCSKKCGFRDKEADDYPILIPDDPEAKYCYCKPADLKEFSTSCKGR